MSDMPVIIKTSTRTKRTVCQRCHTDGDYYWAEVADSEPTIRVLLDQGPLNEGTEHTGNPVPWETVHKCFRRDAGLPLQDPDHGDPLPVPYVSDEEQSMRDSAPADTVPVPPAYVRGENPLADAIRDIVGPVQIDKAEVQNIAREVIGNYVFPTQTVVIRDGQAKTVPGLAHNRLPRVMAALSVGRNVLMVGPAGTGKSYIGEQCADGLGVAFESMSLTAQTGESKFTGFVDAAGRFHATEIYDWATNPDGGLLCLDELDNGNPNILGWMNAVISNRRVRFPNGETVKITPRHYLTGTANTYGFGRTREYVGRNPIDAATKNRFATITIPIDDALETALVHGQGGKADTADKILTYVRKLRKTADAKGVNLVMSPRNSVGMAALLTTDIYDWDMAVEDQIQCGIDEITWAKIAA